MDGSQLPAAIISDEHYFLPHNPETAQKLVQSQHDLASLQMPELAACYRQHRIDLATEVLLTQAHTL